MANTFTTLLNDRKAEISKALASWMTPERFFTLAMQLERNPELKKCTPESLVQCVLEAAAAGLEFGQSGHVYIISYGNVAQLQIGWRGLVFLLQRSGAVLQFDTNIVCDHDQFEIEYRTDGDTFIHKINIKEPRKEENCIGAWARAKLPTGEYTWEFLTKERIYRHKSHSKNPSGLLWTKFWEEGFRKTPARVLYKRIPQGTNPEALDRYASAVTIEARSYKTHDEELGIGAQEQNPDPPVADEEKPPRKVKAQPQLEDRPLTPGEMNELMSLYSGSGGQYSEMTSWLQKTANVDRLEDVKLSQLADLKTQIEQGA